jgi:hypothetical protein
MTSPSPTSTINSDPFFDNLEFNALSTSLLHFSTLPHAASPNLMNTIATKNNPRPAFSIMEDHGLYWFTNDAKPLILGFPAILDLNGTFGKTGPYFSLASNQNVTIFQLKTKLDIDFIIMTVFRHFPDFCF